MSGLSDAEVIARYNQHVNKRLAKIAEQTGLPVEARSAGSRVWDTEGREYLDCGGFGVFLLGHRHPAVVEALHRQLDRHPLSTRYLLSAELAVAAEQLCSVTPEGLDYVYFGCTGSEAVETAIKLARASGRRHLVSMTHGFHGKTMGALSVTDRQIARRPFQPLLPDTTLVPFDDAPALDEALDRIGDKACVLVEPVQGEGGVHVPAAGYLAEVAAICRRREALLVVDEIQTGLGRLGEWWGCSAEGVTPDILLAGKGLGGGCVPASAVIATETAFVPFNRSPRIHSSTFSGAPLTMAAVAATIEVIKSENLVARASSLGERLLRELRTVTEKCGQALVTDVRGAGLLIGIELATPALVGRFTNELLRAGVIVTNPVSVSTVIRFTPPAVLSDADIDWLIGAVDTALGRLLVAAAPQSN